jgi:hypothetical protein
VATRYMKAKSKDKMPQVERLQESILFYISQQILPPSFFHHNFMIRKEWTQLFYRKIINGIKQVDKLEQKLFVAINRKVS